MKGAFDGGTKVEIHGVAMNHDEATVLFNGVAVSSNDILSTHDEKIVFLTPPAPATLAKNGGLVDVQVIQPGPGGIGPQLESNVLEFRYLSEEAAQKPIKFSLMR